MTKEQYIKVIETIINSPRNDLQKITMLKYSFKAYVEETEAHWIKHEYAEEYEGSLIPNYECSNCHTWKRDDSTYCPDCGRKMKEVR